MDETENQIDQPKKGVFRRLWLIVAIILIGFVGFVIVKTLQDIKSRGGGPSKFSSSKKAEIDINNPPKFVQADFISLDRIENISKFRSGSGHDFSGNGETCRSMKHYYNVPWSEEGERLRQANNGMPAKPDGKNDIKIFSPVDGKITRIQTEQTPIGEQIYIEPDSYPDFTIRLFHVYKLAGIAKGSRVKAGEQIGVIGQFQNTDIAVEYKAKFSGPQLISYFNIMPDSLFAEYIKRGAASRDDFSFTKEYRDANPFQCSGEWFSKNNDQDRTQFFYLSK